MTKFASIQRLFSMMLFTVCFTAFQATASAQTTITESIKLRDITATDLQRKDIRQLISQKGIKNTEFDPLTSILNITYDPKKIQIEPVKTRLQQLVANKDTSKDTTANNEPTNTEFKFW